MIISKNPVFPDTNILMAYVMGHNDPTKVVYMAFNEAMEKDVIVVTNNTLLELYTRAERDHKATMEEITAALRELGPKMVFVRKPTPEQLETVHIDDPTDKPILYSARIAGATVILTRDDAWYRDNVFGVDCEIMDVYGYHWYDEVKAGMKTFRNPKFGRIVKIFRDHPRGGSK